MLNTQTITREQVIALAMSMPLDQLAAWYEYGLFMQIRPGLVPIPENKSDSERELQAALAAWEAASDEDWFRLEQQRAKAA
jgi:hypothetical protein